MIQSNFDLGLIDDGVSIKSGSLNLRLYKGAFTLEHSIEDDFYFIMISVYIGLDIDIDITSEQAHLIKNHLGIGINSFDSKNR